MHSNPAKWTCKNLIIFMVYDGEIKIVQPFLHAVPKGNKRTSYFKSRHEVCLKRWLY